MTGPQAVELTAGEAAARIHAELQTAAVALDAAELDLALDAYVRALGLALQLGPAPSETVLRAVLDGARSLARQEDAEGLATLGPAVAGLVSQVMEAGALPASPVMEAWAAVAADIGALLGQWGLALSLPAEHRQHLRAQLQTRARLLDAATNRLFYLAAWEDFMSF
jgi:hypothetical protein